MELKGRVIINQQGLYLAEEDADSLKKKI